MEDLALKLHSFHDIKSHDLSILISIEQTAQPAKKIKIKIAGVAEALHPASELVIGEEVIKVGAAEQGRELLVQLAFIHGRQRFHKRQSTVHLLIQLLLKDPLFLSRQWLVPHDIAQNTARSTTGTLSIVKAIHLLKNFHGNFLELFTQFF